MADQAVHHVLGIPVRFSSNHPEVLRLAERLFGGWPAAPGAAEARFHVQVVPGAGDESPPEFAVSAERVLTVSAGGGFGRCDPLAGEARAAVPQRMLGSETFRYNLLEAMTLWLASHRDRCPLHAAALAHGESALLLTGASGAGKSTLAYAAFRGGLKVLAEDTVYVQSHPAVHVWGMPGFLHLLPDSVERFPELRGLIVCPLPNGKEKIAVDLGAAGGVPELPFARRVGICLVQQGPVLRVESLPAREVVAAVAGHTQGGFGYFEAELAPAVARMGAGGGWRITVPPAPAEAVPELRRMLASL